MAVNLMWKGGVFSMQRDLKTWSINVSEDGEEIDISYTGTVVIMPLCELQHKEDDYQGVIDAYEQDIADMPEAMKADWKKDHAGVNRKSGSGRRADAQIVAMLVQGASIDEVRKTRFVYNKEGHKKVYGDRKIFSASSVNKPGDYERLKNLYLDFPDIFWGISQEQFFGWMSKKAGKRGRSNEGKV